MALQAAVDPLDGVSFILGDDALLNVGINLLVHEVLQLGQVIIWKERQNTGWVYNLRFKEEDHKAILVSKIDQTLNLLRRHTQTCHNLVL